MSDSTTQRVQSMIEGLSSTGMTYSDIARSVKISRQHVWSFKNGDVRKPQYDTVRKIEQLYERRVGHRNDS